MARGALRLTQRETAVAMSISHATIYNFETGCGVSRQMNAFIQSFYERRGVAFDEDDQWLIVKLKKGVRRE